MDSIVKKGRFDQTNILDISESKILKDAYGEWVIIGNRIGKPCQCYCNACLNKPTSKSYLLYNIITGNSYINNLSL